MKQQKEIGAGTLLGILAGASIGGPGGALFGGLLGYIIDNENKRRRI